MWREVQIWLALARAETGGTAMGNESIEKMVPDRPVTQAPIYVSRAEDIPAEYIGHVCVRGTWFHES